MADTTANERRRDYAGPALFSHGFRPFFMFGALFAGCALPIWLTMLVYGIELPGAIQAVDWHSHEMIFGFLAAVIAGFILTAVPNWTGRLPVMGKPLALLFLIWIAGRAAVGLISIPWIVLIVDSSFLLLLSAFIWREVVTGRNWRSIPVCILISLFAAANILFHLGLQFDFLAGYGTRLALGVAAVLIGLIGGRITPSFTRNWMSRMNIHPHPAPFGRLDQVVLLCSAAAMAFWIAIADAKVTGLLLVLAGLIHFARLFRWRGGKTLREPIVAILHIGYAWLAFAYILLGASILLPLTVDASAALHALTAGAIGTMTLAVMSRAILGHTGHAITAGGSTLAAYALVSLGALLRICASELPLNYEAVLTAGGTAWSAAFMLFFITYTPMLIRPQVKQTHIN